ncbi:MAG: hypothetical protein MRZ79_10195 [Bacteroidia bacterium]|nr:hypothetical protein [Bacteroidia bacterium]
MKNLFLQLLIFSLLCSFCGCAMNYHGMKPMQVNYKKKATSHDLEIRYKGNYISSVAESYFISNSRNKNIHFFAVELKNNGIEDVELGRTHFVSVAGKPATLLETKVVHQEVKFRLSRMIPALALSPALGVLIGEDQEPETDTSPAVFLVGPALVTVGMIEIAAQNEKFRSDLRKWNLYGKRISPGSTISGVLAVRVKEVPYNKSLEFYRVEKY